MNKELADERRAELAGDLFKKCMDKNLRFPEESSPKDIMVEVAGALAAATVIYPRSAAGESSVEDEEAERVDGIEDRL